MKRDEIQSLLEEKDAKIQELMVKLKESKQQIDEMLQELFIIRQEQIKLIKGKKKKQNNNVKLLKDELLLDECRLKVGMITRDKNMVQVIRLAKKAAETDCPVLILGESGTGKELIARYIHNSRSREVGRFVAVNTTAIPKELIESELFGYKKGAFTGAKYDKEGYFKAADRGTIFLDEIGDSQPILQAKLLRVMDTGEYHRVGDTELFYSTARIEAATTKDLETEVKKGNFLAELFYRINGIRLELPPLRERTEDIELLTDYFVAEYNRRYKKNVLGMTDDAMRMLRNYHWPGNVREFEQTISRAIALADNNFITVMDLRIRGSIHKANPEDKIIKKSQDDYLMELLDQHNFEIGRTAHELGHDRNYVASHFKGLCLKTLAENNWDAKEAAKTFTNDEANVIRVEEKINEYLKNTLEEIHECKCIGQVEQQMGKIFKNIPKRYHEYILEIYEKYSRTKGTQQ